MTPRPEVFTDPTTLLGIIVAAFFILAFVMMAAARRDESCEPERSCINCAKFDNDKPVPPECCECLSDTSTLKNWTAK